MQVVSKINRLVIIVLLALVVGCSEKVDQQKLIYKTFQILPVDSQGKVLPENQLEYTSTLQFTELGEMILKEGSVTRRGNFELVNGIETLVTTMDERKDTFTVSDLSAEGLTLNVEGGQRIVLKALEPAKDVR